jgi:MerR family redox-sensitive transcriptional activator SoxR
MPALLTIGEVARRAGVRTSAIRYYEEAGLLPEPERVGGKRRRYEEGILRRLASLGAPSVPDSPSARPGPSCMAFPPGRGQRNAGRHSLRKSWSR